MPDQNFGARCARVRVANSSLGERGTVADFADEMGKPARPFYSIEQGFRPKSAEAARKKLVSMWERLRERGVDVEKIAAWAITNAGEMPTAGGAIVPNVSAPSVPAQAPMRAAHVFPSTIGAALVDFQKGALGPQTTWKVIRALRSAPKKMPPHVEVVLAEVKAGRASPDAAERILEQLLPRLDSNQKGPTPTAHDCGLRVLVGGNGFGARAPQKLARSREFVRPQTGDKAARRLRPVVKSSMKMIFPRARTCA